MDHNRVAGVVEEVPELFLALPQCILRLFAFRDVMNNSYNSILPWIVFCNRMYIEDCPIRWPLDFKLNIIGRFSRNKGLLINKLINFY